MGLLDQVLGGMTGGQQQAGGASPLMGLLGGLLSGQSPMAGLAGGLPALLARFQGAGMGDIAQSWVGTGANQPVAPDQVHQALGDQQIDAMAQQTGLPKQDLLSQLAQHLPMLVDRMTPNGHVPASGTSDGGLNI